MAEGLARPPRIRLDAIRFDAKLTIAAWLLAASFAALGAWQLRRAGLHGQREAAQLAQSRLPPLQIGAQRHCSALMRLRRASARGHFDAGRQILLDSQVQDGRAGVRVLTPLQVEGSDDRVLVDRGWTELPAGRSRLPQPRVPEGEVEVRGVIDIPVAAPLAASFAAAEGGDWGRLWPYLDLGRFSAFAGYPVEACVLREDEGGADGLVRSAPLPDSGRSLRSIGYAIQWFALAAAAIVIWARLSLRRPS